MLIGTIAGISSLIQLMTVILALRLIKVTGFRLSWILISCSLVLMQVRRLVSTYHFIFEDGEYTLGLNFEVTGLVTSILMFAGVMLIAPLFQSMVHEISVRKKAEEALRRSERNLKNITSNLAEGIYVLDEKGNIVFMNPEAERLLGWTLAELGGKNVHDVVHYRKNDSTPLPFEECNMHQVIHTGKQYKSTDEVFVRKDGTVFPISVITSPIMDNGQFVASVTAFRDITEQKQAEENLHKLTANLVRSNSDLTQFAYVVSHDLQEPLRTITGLLELLEKRYKGRIAADADEFIRHVVDSAGRMKLMINDLLQYSQVDTRGNKFANVSMVKVIDQAIANLKAAVEKNGAVVSYAGLPEVKADFVQMVRLMQNLIGNAVKFKGDGSPIISVSAARRGNEWVFSVKDNGLGIDPKFAEQIFDVFRRLHSRDQYPGTGIGLAVCRKIVERHGGSIWVDSEPGKGSIFYFTIPV